MTWNVLEPELAGKPAPALLDPLISRTGAADPASGCGSFKGLQRLPEGARKAVKHGGRWPWGPEEETFFFISTGQGRGWPRIAELSANEGKRHRLSCITWNALQGFPSRRWEGPAHPASCSHHQGPPAHGQEEGPKGWDHTWEIMANSSSVIFPWIPSNIASYLNNRTHAPSKPDPGLSVDG